MVSLYEFTFIVQHDLLQHEVEEMICELGVMLKNIKSETILDQIKLLLECKSSKQGLLDMAKSVQESLLTCSDSLEDLAKVLWFELETDLSNLKEIESKVSKELGKSINPLEGVAKIFTRCFLEKKKGKQDAKNVFIKKIMNSLNEDISKFLVKLFQEKLPKSFEIIGSTNRILEMLSRSVMASGLIKYEYLGLIDFAYPIKKMKSGHYCIMCLNSTPSIMGEFVRRVKLNESIVRYLNTQVNRFFEGKSYMINKGINEQSA